MPTFNPLAAAKHSLLRALSSDSILSRQIAKAYHIHWHYSGAWTRSTYLGYPIQQSPQDMQAYQEVLYRVRPSAVVQTGVAYGGSVLYFAHLLDALGADPAVPVIGVDVALMPSARTLTHPRITLIEGSSVDPAVVDRVHALAARAPGASDTPGTAGSGALVSLDSDHTRDHVYREIEAYRELVGVGSYLVVEDVDLNGHPVLPSYGPGPWEAARQFEREDDRFLRDPEVWRSQRMTSHAWYRRARAFPVRGHVPTQAVAAPA